MTVKIGDLLAQIGGATGSSAQPSPNSGIQPSTNALPKRKADDDLRNSQTSKTPRTTSLSTVIGPRPTDSARPRQGDTSSSTSRPTQPSRPLDRPNAQRPINGSGSRSNILPSKPLNGANKVTKPGAPSRPSPGPVTSTAGSAAAAAARAAPKKGSFQEILARAKQAQASMGQVGKIQHKKVEGAAGQRKGRDEPKAEPRDVKKRLPASGYSGTSKPGQRAGPAAQTNGRAKNGRPSIPDRTKATAEEEERQKRFKKSAVATTGYTGTARPRPGATVKKREAPRGGALLAAPTPRPKASKSSRYEDDYDEDMDDFIDYDDEEDEQGPRYGYASDESSDMEAGLDDIDVEERRAAAIARREDIEEERLERSLKAAKEARKRKALESGRR